MHMLQSNCVGMLRRRCQASTAYDGATGRHSNKVVLAVCDAHTVTAESRLSPNISSPVLTLLQTQ